MLSLLAGSQGFSGPQGTLDGSLVKYSYFKPNSAGFRLTLNVIAGFIDSAC